MKTLLYFPYWVFCFGTLCLASSCIDYDYDKGYYFSSKLIEFSSPELRVKNYFISPIGAYLALTALSYGASGETELEMCKTLRRPSKEVLRNNLLPVLDNIKNHIGNSFSISSEILIPGKVNMSDDFINNSQNNFLTSLVQTRLHTLMYTTNRANFKGTWYWKFRETRDIDFHVNETILKPAKAVNLEGYFDQGYLPHVDAKFIIVPFNVTDLDMVIITPNHIDRTFVIEDSLSDILVNDLLEAKKFRDRVDLYLPTFRFVNITLGLEDAIHEMYMERMFSSHADFTNIGDLGDAKLRVKDILQRSTIEVTGDGQNTPEIIIDNESVSYPGVPIKKFIVDRPSVIAIRYQKHYLLIGRLNDPTAA